MSEIQWTEAQRSVIDARNSNLLVAAAAGSGKTAVLVERIIQLITDNSNPVDIDHILVVTFTNAAAHEMKEKIIRAINKASFEHPENDHLLKQVTLAHNAKITTIDGFCKSLLSEYYHEINIEPGFRIVDEGEATLLKSDAMDTVLEGEYQKAEEDFVQLTDIYAKKGKDEGLSDLIYRLYNAASGHPDPNAWLEECLAVYRIDSTEELLKQKWLLDYFDSMKLVIADSLKECEHVMREAQNEECTAWDVVNIEEDLNKIRDLLEAGNLEELVAKADYFKFTNSKNNKLYKENPLTEEHKKRQAAYRQIIKDLMKEVKNLQPEEVLKELQLMYPLAEELVYLTKKFADEFTDKKEDKNLLDFSDLEHLALKVLLGDDLNSPTTVAVQLQNFYREVMVDEYQDSNDVQELLLSTLSGNSIQKYNYFMVGDVKQSIYRFRNARPGIFNAKYKAFHENDPVNKRILLDANFRSRKEILDTTNDIFRIIMQENLGDVLYDTAAELKQGNAAAYPKAADPSAFQTEVLLASADKEAMIAAQVDSDLNLEANLVADRIQKLVQDQLVTDSKTGALRQARYSDIAILLRRNDFIETFTTALKKRDIPVFSVTSTGYFNAVEVETVLSMLRILDNPYQDIPLVAVLHSPMFGFTNEELSFIRAANLKTDFFDCLCQTIELNLEGLDTAKINQFMDTFSMLRQKSKHISIHELIQLILDETGYLNYVTAMPGGDVRHGNLMRLIDQAVTYENTSFKGLFRFIKYIERLQKYDIDFGTAELMGEEDNAVRIMSMHKSKGLEFPICIVSGLCKGFGGPGKNGMDIHPDFGFAIDCFDLQNRVKYRSDYREVMKKLLAKEDKGEELRVLYVALTRAKEKLILTGAIAGAADYLDEKKKLSVEKMASFQERSTAKCYMDWILPVVLKNQVRYQIGIRDISDIIDFSVKEATFNFARANRLKELADCSIDTEEGENQFEILSNHLAYQYPYKVNTLYKNKYSVSEIKHIEMDKVLSLETPEVIVWNQGGNASTVSEIISKNQDDATAVASECLTENRNMNSSDTSNYRVPDFIRNSEKEVNVGALRGTAMHRYMECFDFSVDYTDDNIKAELKRMRDCGLVTKEQEPLINLTKIKTFLQSPFAGRMHNCALNGTLYKEHAFVMGKHASDLFDDAEEGLTDTILIQGIIDVFFKEEDGIILLDYKTDNVESTEKLAALYTKQLQLYADAIEGSFHIPIKELYLYSFKFNELVAVSRS